MDTTKIKLPTWQGFMKLEIESGNCSIELAYLLADITYAGSRIGNAIRKFGIENEITGSLTKLNHQGDQIKKLDVFANSQFIEILKKNKHCSAIISEEEKEVIFTSNKTGKYIVYLDPLDGSSNIDCSIATGSIFSIYEKKSNGTEIQESDLFQPGMNQIAAGYLLYSSSTILVVSTGKTVNSFTYVLEQDSFFLTNDSILSPVNGNTYSVNEANICEFPHQVQLYLDNLKSAQNNSALTTSSSRYIGTMVADMHRTLLKGGIFLYPETRKFPNGKLRLMYECNPFAFLMEKAGGKATNGSFQSILEIVPSSIHERAPLIIGSRDAVSLYENNYLSSHPLSNTKQA